MARRAPPWPRLWQQWAELGVGAPEVVARRLDLMARQPLSPRTLAESQRMVVEKMAAAGEAWWQWWLGAAALSPRAGATPAATAGKAAALASRMVQPARKRVRANVARLRRRK
jgi:hypothetical protein